jgi:hypothetical protein
MSSVFGELTTPLAAGSYLSRQTATMKKIQGAAYLWIIYGVSIDATSVIVANLIVAAMAFYSALVKKSAWKPEWTARLRKTNRQSIHRERGHATENGRSVASHTAMVVPICLPSGVTDRKNLRFSDVS